MNRTLIALALILTATQAQAITKDDALQILDHAGMLASENHPTGCFVGDLGDHLSIGCVSGEVGKLLALFAQYQPTRVDEHIEVKK